VGTVVRCIGMGWGGNGADFHYRATLYNVAALRQVQLELGWMTVC